MGLSEKKLEFRTYEICYKEEDVKKFILKLKEDMVLVCGSRYGRSYVRAIKVIDKLAGEDLVK